MTVLSRLVASESVVAQSVDNIHRCLLFSQFDLLAQQTPALSVESHFVQEIIFVAKKNKRHNPTTMSERVYRVLYTAPDIISLSF